VPIEPAGSAKNLSGAGLKVYSKKRIKRAAEDIAGYGQDIGTL
jgi:hypothetical protein